MNVKTRMFQTGRAWPVALLAAAVMIAGPACTTHAYAVRGSYVSADFSGAPSTTATARDSTKDATTPAITVRSRPSVTAPTATRSVTTVAGGSATPTSEGSVAASNPVIGMASTATRATTDATGASRLLENAA